MTPLKVWMLSVVGSAGTVIVLSILAKDAGLLDGIPTVAQWLIGAVLGLACGQFARWMERRAEARESAPQAGDQS